MEGIPVVLVKGSGGFSDVIAEVLDDPIDNVTPTRIIELMEENDLANKTSCIEDRVSWPMSHESHGLAQSVPKFCNARCRKILTTFSIPKIPILID